MTNKSEENSSLFKPTLAVLNNSKRGIALSKKHNKNLNNILKSSSKLSSVEVKEEMTFEEVKLMYQYLTDIEKKVDLKRAISNEPTSEAMSWYAMGGSAGLAWSKLVLKQKGILKTCTAKKEETLVEDKSVWSKEPVMKSLDEELKQVTYVAMQPGVDLHGDLTEVQEIRKAKENFNKSAKRANLFHMVMTDTFEVIESYLAPVDMIISEHFVEKGSWLMTLQIHDDDLWALVKSGKVNGISIGALANVEELEE